MKIRLLTTFILAYGALLADDGIKDAMPFRFGVAMPAKVYIGGEGDSARTVARHFSSITAENEMKPEALQPHEGEFHWDIADRFVAFGEKNKMKVIGHCLVWHNQTPLPPVISTVHPGSIRREGRE